ncbi:hypothetical protein DM02DRAFT_373240 [Periconia macrospinosa]|uniref:HMG box domain-containing protein n=1 Tax=Periconia macrospinosa TaxID=97972 RepID=A0A2V1CZB4_9PLEO|nr:hypothetical protein DM02DRAFT_373240 [Periconia macrospinosa]
MNSVFSETSTTEAFELTMILARLGLSEYDERLQENGFEDWETVALITEADMAELDFKLGDRRKLQRAISEYSSSSASHGLYEIRISPLSSDSLSTVGEYSKATPQSWQQAPRSKRQYRRRPRPDPNAPHKPETAYVLFGKHVRQDPALSHSSFTDFAKETGKRWKELSHRERMIWETLAADSLQHYREEIERYKQTENYRKHQTYLEEFEQRRQSAESTIPRDKRFSYTHKSAISGQLSASDERFEAIHQESVDKGDLDRKGQLQYTASPVKDAMEAVRHIPKAFGINAHLTRVTEFPPEDMTTKAVEAFVHGTGSLLYLWNQDEAFNLVRSVYHPRSDLKLVYASEVFAMSAVGSYCDAEPHSMLAREKFLHFFLNLLSSSSDVSELRRMRLFACLAICCFANNVGSARSHMLSALSMGRQAFTITSFEVGESEEKVRYWRDVYRSVIFIERSVRSVFCLSSFWTANIHSAGSHIIQAMNHESTSKIWRYGSTFHLLAKLSSTIPVNYEF